MPQPVTATTATLVDAGGFSFDQLANIYNASRIDYIVPMPMNAQRMREYVRFYDVDLNASFVVQNARQKQKYIGIGMLGLRQERAWVTRVGILPESRGQHVGQLVIGKLFDAAQERGAQRVQLEVIEGNEPAIKLFRKFGFEPIRNLLVLRRAPHAVEPLPESVIVTALPEDAIQASLRTRSETMSWLDETASLINAGNLEGLSVILPDGAEGWLVFRNTLLQITHVVIHAPNDEVAAALLRALYIYYPRHDTKLENLDADSPLWPVLQTFGYGESFRRIEMVKQF